MHFTGGEIIPRRVLCPWRAHDAATISADADTTHTHHQWQAKAAPRPASSGGDLDTFTSRRRPAVVVSLSVEGLERSVFRDESSVTVCEMYGFIYFTCLTIHKPSPQRIRPT